MCTTQFYKKTSNFPLFCIAVQYTYISTTVNIFVQLRNKYINVINILLQKKYYVHILHVKL